MSNLFLRKSNESEESYIHRICQMKEESGWTWQDIADILNSELHYSLSKDAYRMRERHYVEPSTEIEQLSIFEEESTQESLTEILHEIKKERVKLNDERSQNNAIIRRIAREETIRDIAKNLADNFNYSNRLPQYKDTYIKHNDDEGILLLSDWHYGINIDNFWNKYNPEVAKERITKLRDTVIKIVTANELSKLHVINLGDLISGRIHNTIRLNNRIDVITQTMEVSEILAEFLNSISEYVPIEYHDTADNHSRLEPDLKDSLELESLTRVITEFLKLRLKDNKNVLIIDNTYGDDMATFNVCGHKCIGVHGNKDKTKSIIDKLTMITRENFDLVVSAHLHHFSSDEQNETIRVSNGSVMGTDDYAVDLRLNSKPSQTLIISSNYNVAKSIHKIDLE